MSGGAVLTAALDYAARGWHIVAVHGIGEAGCSCGDRKCGAPGKRPHIANWSARASTDPEVIEGWWRKWPPANVGVVTGCRSGIVALDVDPRNGGDDTLADLERDHGELPPTIESLTGGSGRHIIFASPGDGGRSFDVGPGVEWKGERGLIVLPPSVHASGRRYEWEVCHHPDDAGLAEPPEWLCSRIKKSRSRSRARLAAEDVVREGERNVTLTSEAGRMRLVGLSPEAVLAALMALNIQRCKPALPEWEVEQIARSAGRWHALPWIASPREFFTDPNLNLTPMLVLRVLCDYADRDGTCRHVSFQTIRQRTGIGSDTTVGAAIKALEAAQRVTVERRYKQTSVYRINRTVARRLAPEEPHTPGCKSSRTGAGDRMTTAARPCENCGASLDGRRRQARYCGGPCRAAASRTRAALRASTGEREPMVARGEETARNRTLGAREHVAAAPPTAAACAGDFATWPLASAGEEARLAAAIQKYPDLAWEAA